MIEAQQLRIGNWVLHKGHEVQVEDICNGDDMHCFRSGPMSAFGSCNSIPLSSDVLERCGFEKGCLAKMINDDWFIHWTDDCLWIQVEVYVKYEKSVCERTALTHIKYLHQLQNLYYSLTGEELIYTPKK